MNKLLITGASGMVGLHFIDYILKHSTPRFNLLATSRSGISGDNSNNISHYKLDLLSSKEVEDLLVREQPNYVLHLASQSSVAVSWKNPNKTISDNTTMLLNLLEAIAYNNINCKVLVVSSAEVYGYSDLFQHSSKESDVCLPLNPYALSRKLQEELVHYYRRVYKLHIAVARSFNHIGVHQNQNFFVPSIIRQVVATKKENKHYMQLEVGNVNLVRDFLDVQDVIIAYEKILLEAKDGCVYNVCSGKGIQLKELILILAKITGIEIDVVVKQDLLRNHDNPYLVGDRSKISNELQWEPQVDLQETLTKIYTHYMNIEH